MIVCWIEEGCECEPNGISILIICDVYEYMLAVIIISLCVCVFVWIFSDSDLIHP